MQSFGVAAGFYWKTYYYSQQLVAVWDRVLSTAACDTSSNSGLEHLNTHVTRYKLIEQEVFMVKCLQAPTVSVTERKSGWSIIVVIMTSVLPFVLR